MRSLPKRRNGRLTVIAMPARRVEQKAKQLIAVIARLDRAIQYAAASPHTTMSLEYWIARFRGR
ncbi:hypothetical protein [Bradyrhizobium centrolobii]|nr:hypothetical protein [Bradyrhizobium centrolobii]